jgi:hypothetical protein
MNSVVEDREAVKKNKLQEIENITVAALEKLKVKYEIVHEINLSLTVFAIIIIISFIIIIISPDFCRIASYFNKFTHISKKLKANKEQVKDTINKRNYLRNIDRCVLNYELNKPPRKMKIIFE